MNVNYRAGRNAEYKRIKAWRESGHTCIRAAGSHGVADFVAIERAGAVHLIQVKLAPSHVVAERLIKNWTPFLDDGIYYQHLEVCIRGSREVLTATRLRRCA